MINGDSERLDEIEQILRTGQYSINHFLVNGNKVDVEWLISSLRLAWAQNEVMKEALQYYKQGLDGGYQGYELKAKEALKRCEELRGGK